MPIFGGNIRMHAPLSIIGIRKVKLRTGQVERQKNRIQSTRCSQQSDLRMRSALYSQQTVSMASAVLPFTWLTSSFFYRTSALRRRRHCRVSNKLRRDETVWGSEIRWEEQLAPSLRLRLFMKDAQSLE